jgi:hypothetical protein
LNQCCFEIPANSFFDSIGQDAKIKAGFAEMGGVGLAGTPADFAKLLADETESGAGL